MNRDEIMRMAREAKLPDPMVFYASIERFAALVAAAEREACADILDRNADRCDPYSIAFDVLDSNAKAIRARGTP